MFPKCKKSDTLVSTVESGNGAVVASDHLQDSQTIPERFALDSKYNGLSHNVWKEIIDLERKFKPSVDLSFGSPDFTPVQEIVDKWNCGFTENSKMHQYSLPSGHPRLANVLGKLYGKILGRVIDPAKEIIITIGASNALFCAIMSNIGHGEEVIIIEPYFDLYESLVKLAGGTPVFIPLRQMDPDSSSSAAWKLDVDELESLFNSKTKALIINTPNNPLGKIFTKSELNEIANLCQKYKVLIISDEVCEFLIYEGKHERMSSILWDQTITLGSVGKTFGLTGWRIGWAYGPDYLIKNLQVAFSNGIYQVETPCQEIIAATLEVEIEKLGTPDSIFTKMNEDLKARRDQMVQIVTDAGMRPIIPEAGIFVIANWSSLSSSIHLNEESDDASYRKDFRFIRWLVKNRSLLAVPPSMFYSVAHKELAEDQVRFCFYRKTETLLKASQTLNQLKTPRRIPQLN